MCCTVSSEQELLVLCESRRMRCSQTRLQLHNKTIATRHGETLFRDIVIMTTLRNM